MEKVNGDKIIVIIKQPTDMKLITKSNHLIEKRLLSYHKMNDKDNIMRLIMCLFLLASVSVTLFAQHRLTREFNTLRPADQIVKQQVEFKDPGSSGRQLTWDFRMLQPLNEEYSLKYFIPDSTRMDTICGMEHRTRYYYSQKRDSVWAIGFENATTMMEYHAPELRMRFPFGYGDTLFSYFEGSGEYSRMLKLSVKGYTSVEADAEGELLLPDFESVKNALRIRTLRYYTEIGMDSTEMQLDTYSWYAEGIRYPVFESVKTDIIRRRKTGNGNESVSDTTIFTTSFYYPPLMQTSQVQTEPLPENSDNTLTGAEAVFTEAKLLPNPVVQQLHIQYKLTRNARIWFTVHNNVGISVCQTTPMDMTEGYHDTTINMGHLLTGTYMLYVHVDDMVLQRVVVKK
ncbi:MAG: hypothetical protein BGO29_01600 [Bacteroidales bacterium 36-12]|nr:MAG: hypothetical protein BGO29_01600 [Bacteroidales bacterium 36-12]